MKSKTVVVSANMAWNLTNFRAGLIRALIEDGYRIVAVVPPDTRQQNILTAMGCTFWPIDIDAKGLSPYRDFRTFLAYLRLFRQTNPTAFLGWTIKPNIYGAIAARFCGVPSILNVSGLGTAFIRESTVTRIVSWLYRVAFRRAQTVFFQNSSDRDLFVSRGLVAQEKTHLLAGSGIDLSRFPSAQSADRPHGRFIMIARLLADKGVREYIAAAKLVRSDFPDAQFVLAGFLDVANRTAITRAEVDRWVCEGIIEYQPPVDDIRPLVASADCVVLPSYREGTSRILLEAAAMGRPVIATDVPGCREVVESGRTGFLCAVRDACDLADAMRQLLRMDDEGWRAMGAAGRRKVRKEFAESDIIDAYRDALT